MNEMKTEGQENKPVRKRLNLFGILFAVWGAFIFGFWLSTWNNTKAFAENTDGYVRLIELLVIGGILLECLVFKKWGAKWSHKQRGMIIFSVALAIRLISLIFSKYVPSSDFKAYFDGACYFLHNGIEGKMYSELKRFGSAYAWQPIINALFLSVFSPTLLGMQILNSLFTAGICAFIYLIGRSVNSRAALVGAILYTFYPISILSTHITTNHHGATFFLLAGVYLFEIMIEYSGKGWKKLLLLLISVFCFAISNCYHPSIVIVLCSLIITMLINEAICLLKFRKTYFSHLLEDIRQFRGRFLLTIAVIIIYEMIASSGMIILGKTGYMDDVAQSRILGKIVVGLNQETGGSWSGEDYRYARTHTSKEVIEIIKERLSDPIAVINLMAQKTKNTWFYWDDNYNFFYTLGMERQLSEKIEKTSDEVVKEECTEQLSNLHQVIDNIALVDTLYVNCIWLLAIVGIGILIVRYQDQVRIYSFLFIPMGWMAFITFTEMQQRYRYQSMPAVIFLAALGIVGIGSAYEKLKLHCSGKDAKNFALHRESYKD